MTTLDIPDTTLSENSLLVTRWAYYLNWHHPNDSDQRCRNALAFWASGRITDAVLSPLLVRMVNDTTSSHFEKLAMSFAISREAGRAYLRSDPGNRDDLAVEFGLHGKYWLDWRDAFEQQTVGLPFLWGMFLEPDPQQARWDLLSLHRTVEGGEAAVTRWGQRPDAAAGHGWLHIAPVPVKD